MRWDRSKVIDHEIRTKINETEFKRQRSKKVWNETESKLLTMRPNSRDTELRKFEMRNRIKGIRTNWDRIQETTNQESYWLWHENSYLHLDWFCLLLTMKWEQVNLHLDWFCLNTTLNQESLKWNWIKNYEQIETEWKRHRIKKEMKPNQSYWLWNENKFRLICI